MSNVWAMAGFQVREMLQRRVVWLVALVGAIGLVMFGAACHLVTTQPMPVLGRSTVLNQILSGTLLLSSLLCSMLAIFTAISALANEIDTGRIQMVVSRPVSRRRVLLGTFGGLTVVTAGYSMALCLCVLLLFGFSTGIWPAGWWRVVPVFALGPEVVLTLAVLLSVRLTVLTAGIASLALLILTWIGDFTETIGYIAHLDSLQVSGVLMSLLLPAGSMHDWVSGTLRTGIADLTRAPFELALLPVPSVWMILYTLVYMSVLLAWAVSSFRQRDL